MDKQIVDKLEKIEKEYFEIEKEMNDPNVFFNIEKLKILQKFEKKYKVIHNKYQEYKSLLKDNKDLEVIIEGENDNNVINSYKNLLKENYDKLKIIEEEIIDLLIEKDPNDSKNAIVEISKGIGGEEGNLFAADLFEMYKRFCHRKNLTIEVNDSIKSEKGGFTFISFIVEGDGAYGMLKYESGIHRVQRVPETESQGKLQTSTAKVYVIPENDDPNIIIDNSDLRIDTYRSSGAGGQHVNKTDSAVRITHIPTGLSAASQDGRSQHDNKDKAMKALKSKIKNIEIEKEREKLSQSKREILGSGERSEKIRTYNYPENRVTDHRANLKLKKLDQVMNGYLDEIINALSKVYDNED